MPLTLTRATRETAWPIPAPLKPMAADAPAVFEVATIRPSNPDVPAGLFTAIQEQLGLKLESTKAPVEVLVIDRVEKPSDN